MTSLVRRDALGFVELAQLVGGLERPVVVGGLCPGDVRRAGDVARDLRLLLRQMIRRELLAPELLRRTHVDEAGVAAHLPDHLVAERADLWSLGTGDREPRRLQRRRVLRELATLELPLLAAAVQELHVLEPTELEEPVCVRSEPVVVATVEHHRGLGADACRRRAAGENPAWSRVVAADPRVQVGGPVPPDSASDMPLLVRLDVLVHLDDPDVRVVDVLSPASRCSPARPASRSPSCDHPPSPARRAVRTAGAAVRGGSGDAPGPERTASAAGAGTAQARRDHGTHESATPRSDHGPPLIDGPPAGMRRLYRSCTCNVNASPRNRATRGLRRRRVPPSTPPTSSRASMAAGAPSRDGPPRCRAPATRNARIWSSIIGPIGQPIVVSEYLMSTSPSLVDLDLVHQPQVDDVDPELGIEHALQRFAHLILQSPSGRSDVLRVLGSDDVPGSCDFLVAHANLPASIGLSLPQPNRPTAKEHRADVDPGADRRRPPGHP